MWASKKVTDNWFLRYERAEKYQMDKQKDIESVYRVIYGFSIIFISFILIGCIFPKFRLDLIFFMVVIPLTTFIIPIYIYSNFVAVGNFIGQSGGNSDVVGMQTFILLVFSVIAAIVIMPISLLIGCVAMSKGGNKEKTNREKT